MALQKNWNDERVVMAKQGGREAVIMLNTMRVRERERENVCMCVCIGERKRKREKDC